MKEQKKMSVLELPLKVEKWQADDIDKRLEHARVIYNQMLGDRLRAYNEMTKTKVWRDLSETIKEELQKAEGSKKKSDKLKQAYDAKNKILIDNGFSEFGFSKEIKYYYTYYQKTISSQVAAASIATSMWRAFSKLIYGNGEKVHFKKRNEFNSLVSPRTGLRFIEEDGKYFVVFSNKTAKARTVKIPVKGPNTEYDVAMLHSGEIKQCRVVRRFEKGYYKKKGYKNSTFNNANYYVQLVIASPAHIKTKEDGTLCHPVGKGTVGVAIWRNTVCAVSQDKIILRDLAPNAEEFEYKRDELNRRIEAARRQGNPQNFNEDGTIKKGIIGENGKRERLTWYYSNSYKKLRAEKRNLERIENVKRDLLKDEIVYQLLEMGDSFYIMDTSFLTNKPEWDPEEPLTNREYKKKKERRKSIQSAAPATFISKLNQKLVLFDKEPVNKIDIPEDLYWYNHEQNDSCRDYFSENVVLTKSGRFLITAYRAFLIRHYDIQKGCYDVKGCEKDWNDFVKAYKEI